MGLTEVKQEPAFQLFLATVEKAAECVNFDGNPLQLPLAISDLSATSAISALMEWYVDDLKEAPPLTKGEMFLRAVFAVSNKVAGLKIETTTRLFLPRGGLGYYEFRLDVSKLPTVSFSVNKSVVNNLSPKEIYEQNKSRSVCISCGKPLEDRMLLSGVIKYCRSCCG